MNDQSIYYYLKTPFLSSVISGFLSLSIYPIDLVNTIMKTHSLIKPAPEVVKELYHKVGIKGFYKGSSMIMYEHIPSFFIYFFSYDFLNKKFSDIWIKNNYKQRWMIPIFTSFLAELSCLAYYVPLDTILTRMQSHDLTYNYSSVWDGIRKIYKNEGLVRFYYSSHLTISYSLLFTTFQFTLYEWLKSFYLKNTNNSKFGIKESIIGSLLSTTAAIILSNPIDTLVIQHQMMNFKQNQHDSTFTILKKEYKQYGTKVFIRSVGMRMLGLNAYYLATIPIYEMFRQKYGMEIDI